LGITIPIFKQQRWKPLLLRVNREEMTDQSKLPSGFIVHDS
jgi:hypothetical protein